MTIIHLESTPMFKGDKIINYVAITPKQRLDPAQQYTYQNTLASLGCIGVQSSNMSMRAMAPIEVASKVADALRNQGFDVTVGETLQKVVQNVVDDTKLDFEYAKKHLELVETMYGKYWYKEGLNRFGKPRRLYNHQRQGAVWLRAGLPAKILADDLGLGKTIETLVALPFDVPVLVVGTAGAKSVWRNESDFWRPDFDRVVTLNGKGSLRWPKENEMVITNYDILGPKGKITGEDDKSRLNTDLGEPPDNLILIADEVHGVKSSKTSKTRRFAGLCEIVRTSDNYHTWFISGTPIVNNPDEFWTILKLANLHEVAYRSRENFDRIYAEYYAIRKKIAEGEKVDLPKPNADAIAGFRKVALRRIKTDHLPDLPKKSYKRYDANGIDEHTRKLCDLADKELKANGIDLSKAISEAELSRIGTDFGHISKARQALATAKIPHMFLLIDKIRQATGNPKEPIVVFSAHRAPIEALRIKKNWPVIMGGVSDANRETIIKEFQNTDQHEGIGLTIRTAQSITLTRACHAIFVDRDWTPAMNLQSEDRICRISQERMVVVHDLIADHQLDQRVTDVLLFKQNMIDNTVEAATVKDIVPDMKDWDPLLGSKPRVVA